MPFALKESVGGWNVHQCFVSLYSIQSEIVGWNKRSGSTMILHTPRKLSFFQLLGIIAVNAAESHWIIDEQ